MSERPIVRHSTIWKPENIEDIQAKADLGRYRIRGFSALRDRPLPSFDDLTFVPCTLTRVPLEGYREKCSTKTVLGARFAKKPIEIDIPIMVTGMSYGALSYNAKVALAKACNARRHVYDDRRRRDVGCRARAFGYSDLRSLTQPLRYRRAPSSAGQCD